MKILIIEDEKELIESLSTYFRAEGYVCEIAGSYQESIMKMSLYDYDCFIVDICLPDGNGMDFIRELKKNKEDPGVIILSAKKSIEDKLEGLNIGADDYLTKPFHLSELNARIRSILRRRKMGGAREITINEIRVIPDLYEVYINETPVTLTKKEFDLLLYFIVNRNRIITKESIVEFLWGDYMDSSDSFDFIYTHIKNLRKKMMAVGGKDYIRNINRVGYKFKAD